MPSRAASLRDFGPAGAALGAAGALALGAVLAVLVFLDGRADLRLQLSVLGPNPALVNDLPFLASCGVASLLLLGAGFLAWIVKTGGLERPALGLFAFAMVADAIPGLSQVATALLLIVLIRRVFRDGDVPAPLTPLAIPLLLVVVSYATTLLLTDQWMSVMPTFLFRISGNIFPVVLLPAVLRTRRQIEIFFHMLLASGCISVGVEWIQWVLSAAAGTPITFSTDVVGNKLITPWGVFPQLTGLMFHPNIQANCISTLAVLALWFGLRPRGTISPGRRWMYLAAYVWLGAGVLFTWSRSGWLALGIATLVIPLLRYPRFAPVYAAVCLVGGAAAYQTGLLQATYEFVEDLNQASADFRWRISSLAADAFYWHPWAGVGTKGILDYANPWKLQVHNTYMQVVGEMGLIGVAAFVALILTVLARLLQALRSRFAFDREWVIGLMLAALVSLVQNTFVMFLWVRFLWLLIPLAECVYLASRERDGREPADLPFLPAPPPVRSGTA